MYPDLCWCDVHVASSGHIVVLQKEVHVKVCLFASSANVTRLHLIMTGCSPYGPLRENQSEQRYHLNKKGNIAIKSNLFSKLRCLENKIEGIHLKYKNVKYSLHYMNQSDVRYDPAGQALRPPRKDLGLTSLAFSCANSRRNVSEVPAVRLRDAP